jgi:hypothetical protein
MSTMALVRTDPVIHLSSGFTGFYFTIDPTTFVVDPSMRIGLFLTEPLGPLRDVENFTSTYRSAGLYWRKVSANLFEFMMEINDPLDGFTVNSGIIPVTLDGTTELVFGVDETGQVAFKAPEFPNIKILHVASAPNWFDPTGAGMSLLYYLNLVGTNFNTVAYPCALELVRKPENEYPELPYVRDIPYHFSGSDYVADQPIESYRPAASFDADDEMPLVIPLNPSTIVVLLRTSFDDDAAKVCEYGDGVNDSFTLENSGDDLNLTFAGTAGSTTWTLTTSAKEYFNGEAYEVAVVLARNALDPAQSWAQLWVNEEKVVSTSNLDLTVPFNVDPDSPATLMGGVGMMEAVAINALTLDFTDETSLDLYINTGWLAFKQN